LSRSASHDSADPELSRARALPWLVVAGAAGLIVLGGESWQLPGSSGWPPGLIWAVLSGAGLLVIVASRRRLRPTPVLAVLVVSGWLVVDLTFLGGQALRDLDLYLKAGLHFRLGQPVYLSEIVTSRPLDPTDYPYLYPPPTLPIAALLSSLPRTIVASGWVVALVAAALVGLGRIGIGGWWRFVFLAWPPFAEGIYVGNVAVLLFLLVALAPWSGVGLVLGPLLKPPSAVISLWLVAEQRWRDLVVGMAILGGIVLVTLPLTGTELWADWLAGLGWFARSQPLVPATFYGIALGRYLPAVAVTVIGFGLLALAVLARGRPLLGRLGLVSVAVSPSLYAHGFMVALPALLELRALALWVALAFTAGPHGPAWFGTLAIVVIGWFAPMLRRPAAPRADGRFLDEELEDRLHPLGPAPEPWPGAPPEAVGTDGQG
jgi:Glycosyltransferase family 87